MRRSRFVVLALLTIAACKAKEEPPPAPTPSGAAVPAGIATSPPIKEVLRPGGGSGAGSGARPQCAFITAEDVSAVVGKPVTVHQSPAPDACGAFAVDGEDVVIVGRRDGSFDAMVGAVPSQYFPRRTDVPGVGDSASCSRGRRAARHSSTSARVTPRCSSSGPRFRRPRSRSWRAGS